MAKFRSWMIHEFYYWKDGDYYLDVDCKRKNKYLDLQESGFWQNAEQSTGMVDKNVREIFENDIVKNSKGETATVIYHPLIYGFTVLFESEGIDKLIGMFEDLENIGNIHEGKSK